MTLGAAAASKAVAVAAAATRAVGPKGSETKAVAVAAAATKAPPAVGLKGFETKAVAVAAAAKKAKSAAAEEDAKALEAREVWKTRCSTCSKAYHTCMRMLESLLESIPAKGKLALLLGVRARTRTPDTGSANEERAHGRNRKYQHLPIWPLHTPKWLPAERQTAVSGERPYLDRFCGAYLSFLYQYAV